MTKKILLSIFLVVQSGLLIAQQNERFFLRTLDGCGLDGYSTEDYIVKLYSDTLISIVIYTTPCGSIPGGFFSKTTYLGTYHIKGDTCVVSGISGYSEKKYIHKEGVKRTDIPSDKISFISPATFVVDKGMISSPTFLFPELWESTRLAVITKEKEFFLWEGKNKLSEPQFGRMTQPTGSN